MPSGKVNVPLAYVQWIALMVVGVGLGFAVNAPLGFTMLALWVMGCLYNIPPVRSKDLPVPRRALGVDQQPAAHAGRLVHDRHDRPSRRRRCS